MKKILFVVLLGWILGTISCSKEDIPKIPECDGSLALTIDKTDATSCSAANGEIIAAASSGTGPYEFSLSGGAKQASGTFSNLSPGTYSITVFDANDCEAIEENIIILAPGTTLAIEAIVTGDSECVTNNGSVTLSATGGNTTGAYQFSFNGSAFSATITYNNLAPGSYSAKVKDLDGCIVSKNVSVAALPSVSFADDIKPLIDTNCSKSGCHGDTQTSFSNYTEIKAKASQIKTLTGNGTMPKTGSLSSTQIAIIACWVNEGGLDN
jgi:SprB repeat